MLTTAVPRIKTEPTSLDKGTPGERRGRKATVLASSMTPSTDATQDFTTAELPQGVVSPLPPGGSLKPIVTNPLTAVLLAVPVGALLLVAGCQSSESVSPSTDNPVLAQAPATGNGNKVVIPVNEPVDPVDCNGEQLTGQLTGWVQGRLFREPNPNVSLDVFHFLWTFTNSAGEIFRFNDVGPNRVHFDSQTGELVLEATGRAAGLVIGHIRINLDTEEIEFIAGKDADLEALACEALT